MLRIYNTLTRKKEEFKPIEPGKVGMYVCGVTIYDYCHIGHGRTFVCFDVIVRYLRYLGYKVTYVRNVTDVDDKIIKRAAENHEPISSLTSRMEKEMHSDFDALGMLRPDIEPHATENIDGIIGIVKRLIDNGNAYVAGNGDVMFSIDSFPEYGRLSGQKLDDLRAGARVGVEESKHNPYDFVLWKMSKPGEPEWDSPWGKGRPGEIAQSCCAFHTTYVNTWIHSGMVMINKEKMSKSLGNFFTIRDVLKEHAPEAVRFFLLSGQYRTALNYSKENLEQARAALARLYTALRGLELPASADAGDDYADYEKRFREAMDDDFNTPLALSVLFDLAKEVNSLKEKSDPAAVKAGLMLKKLGGVLGILQGDPERFLKGGAASDDAEGGDAEIEALVRERNEARARKDWKAADAARNKLQELGIVLEDGPNGTVWRRK